MTTTEELDVNVEEIPGSRDTPEVEVNGDDAVIRIRTVEGVEERRVKLPKATWG